MRKKKAGDDGEQIVINYFKRRGISAKRADHGKGYDVVAGDKLIEVKSTGQSIEQKSFFNLTENEFLSICKNKNSWLFWVDTKNKKIVMEIKRDDVLKNSKAFIHYALYLTKLKKSVRRK